LHFGRQLVESQRATLEQFQDRALSRAGNKVARHLLWAISNDDFQASRDPLYGGSNVIRDGRDFIATDTPGGELMVRLSGRK